MRNANIKRVTKETEVEVKVTIDGNGNFAGSTGIKFLDHMLQLLAYHSLMDLEVNAKWDLVHHGVEDVAMALGQAIGQALGDRSGVRRFGFALVPMDEALSEASVDLVRRAHAKVDLLARDGEIEDIKVEDAKHFFETVALSIPCVVHVNVCYGENLHHMVESATKAFAVAFRAAASHDPARKDQQPSSKGVV